MSRKTPHKLSVFDTVLFKERGRGMSLNQKEKTDQFLELLKVKLSEYGLQNSTAQKICKELLPIKVCGTQLTSYCEHSFYLDHIVFPQMDEIQKLVQNVMGEEYTFHISPQKKSKKKQEEDEGLQQTLERALLGASGEEPPFAVHLEVEHLSPQEPYGESLAENYPEQQTGLGFNQPNQKLDFASSSVFPSVAPSKEILNSEMSFETFVRCKSNDSAYLASESVAKSPGRHANPLFLYGATGLGKTHLLQSVGNEILKQNPELSVLYVSSNDFINDVIHRGIKTGKMQVIRKKYCSCDVLLIDDVQFLENKEFCQLEFFYIFNELYQRKKQIVLTSDKFPKDIPNIEARLVSRFLQGLLVDIDLPNCEDRASILEMKSKEQGLSLSPEHINLIASHAKTNVRELEGLLKDLKLVSKNAEPFQKEDILKVLKKRFGNEEPSEKLVFTISYIQECTARFYQIRMAELLGTQRRKNIVMARHVAMSLAKDFLGLNITEIARAFGKKDHTTVMHALCKVKELMAGDQEFAAGYHSLKTQIMTQKKNH